MGITQPTEVPPVTIGGRTIILQSFKAFKAAHVAAIVSGVTDQAKQVAQSFDDFRHEYRNTHNVRVGQALASIRGWEVPDDQWKIDDQGEKYIELPSSPPDELAMLHVFEQAYLAARVQVQRLLALLLVDNDRLADAEDQGPEQIDALLDAEGKKLMREAEVWEILDLLHAARLLLVREMEHRAEKAGKLRGLWSTIRSNERPQPEPKPATETTPTPPESTTPTATSTGSPTSAPTPTDGPADTQSTALATATSSTS